jgi:hypothetical protein
LHGICGAGEVEVRDVGERPAYPYTRQSASGLRKPSQINRLPVEKACNPSYANLTVARWAQALQPQKCSF